MVVIMHYGVKWYHWVAMRGKIFLMQASYNSQFRSRVYKPTINIWSRDIIYSPTDDGLKSEINFYYLFQKPKIEKPMQGNALACVI